MVRITVLLFNYHMKLFSKRTFLEVFNQILINLSSGWFGVVLIAPGFFGASSPQQYFGILLQNLPFGILGLMTSSYLSERIKALWMLKTF